MTRCIILAQFPWVEGKSLGFCGTSLDMDNFSEGYMCLRTSGNYTQVEIPTGNS